MRPPLRVGGFDARKFARGFPAAILGVFAIGALMTGPAAADQSSAIRQQATFAAPTPAGKVPATKIKHRKSKPRLPVIRRLVRAGGPIGENLIASGIKMNVPRKIMEDMVRMLKFAVDLQRELGPKDKFEVLYEQARLASGKPGAVGALVYAGLVLKNRRLGVWRFTPAGGGTDYFTAQGRSVRTGLLRTPVDGARISSNFGMRKHPILGYSRMHRGVDFAVPRGTPVYAAGDGTVEAAGFNRSYGWFVRIRHEGGYRTLYAHMKGLTKGLTKNSRLKQGQVIGKSGSTGLSTGPHLHHEVWKGGEAIDPASLRLQPRLVLRGKALEAFRWHAAMTGMKPAMRLGQLRKSPATKKK
ncbi:MAG: M23 family metallopeptidase [Alphaproteobacteria bacterium]